jgi:beta-glucosidase
MKIPLRIPWLLFLFILFGTNVNAQYKYPFQDPNLSAEERINNIVSLLTLDEKVACLGTNPSVARLGIKGTGHVEGLHGLALGGPGGWGGRGKTPIPTTTFPQEIGLGETWDPEMIRLVASIEGYEVRYAFQSPKYQRGGMVVRAPNADLGRDIRWGRTEECYGEDAFFNARMVVSYVKGLQGNDPRYWQAASLMKHFLSNSNEVGRGSSSSNYDERLFREYYSYPFYKGITEGGSRAFMAAYNAYNGIPCTVNPMLKEIAIKEWGQNGIICTDGGAYTLLVTEHKYFPAMNQAAAACTKAGITQYLDRYTEGIYSALANKLISETEIDEVIKGNFRVMIKLGLLDPPSIVPYSNIGIADTIDPWTTEKHKSAVRLVTQKSIVLLKNANDLLPLNKTKIKNIAIIGRRAKEVLLDWYSGTPPYIVTPLEGIKKKVPAEVTVNYAYSNNIDSAAIIAKNADVAIVFVGNHPTGDAGWAQSPVLSDGKEAVDRRSISMEQEDLIKEVVKANPNTIVVLMSSFPFAINWTQEHVPAILHMAQNSQETGNALADVIFGDVNPAGRLVQTWPKSIDQLPDMMDYNIRNGRTYMYFKQEPLYPFGFGLSYTSFTYSNLKVNSKNPAADGEIVVSVTVSNTGKRAGDEVVQLYVSHVNSKVERPIKELKGFERIYFSAGETKTVQIILKKKDLAYWDKSAGGWIVEKDKIKIMIGSSSADIKLSEIVEL